MAIDFKHATQAVGTNAGNGEIGKDQWNEGHLLTMASNRLLGRTSAGSGTVEEISIGTGLTFSAGQLSASGASGDQNVDGGIASSVYLPSQVINGGSASG